MVSARKIIRSGGAHVTMPVWGNILTAEQLDALVQYTLAASKANGTQAGGQLFADNCSACHGQFGQGGPNPGRAGETIPPISSAEFLGTRDDATLHDIVSQGQPDLGMNPFGSAYGGPLTDDQVSSLVSFIRGWQANPPQVAPAVAPTPTPAQPILTADQIFKSVCAQCHGANGEGGSGPALNTPEFQTKFDDQALAKLISDGVPSTQMIGVGGVFSQDQIKQLVSLVRSLRASPSNATTPTATPSFAGQVLPILQAKCQMCHSASTKLGGFDASSYQSVMKGSDDGPVVVAGNVTTSVLAQWLQGRTGMFMPPGGALPKEDLQTILDWIAAGAKDN
jgi:mono/diheme cytochrome c family protein